MLGVEFINQADQNKKTQLYYALNDPKLVYILLKAGADPFSINPADITNSKVLEILQCYWLKLLTYRFQSSALNDFYYELISKQSLLYSFYGKNEKKVNKSIKYWFSNYI